MQEYIVIEIQVAQDGAVATIAAAYEDYGAAFNKYHTILAAAAVSALPVHSAIVLDPYGNTLAKQAYTHDTDSADEAE